MKSLFFALNIFFMVLVKAQSWQFVNLQSGNRLEQTSFWSDTGVIIGSNGAIIHTNDFFNSFTVDTNYIPTQFEALSFPVRNHGYISAPEMPGGMLISNDGGDQWTPNYGCEYVEADFGNIVVFGSIDTGYSAVSAGNEYLETDNGGMDWKVHTISLTNCKSIIQINIVSDTIFYVLGSNDPDLGPFGDLRLFMSRGINGTWQELTFFPNLFGVGDFKFIDDSLVIFTAGNNISKSIDAGNTFETVMQSTSMNDNYDWPGHFISFVGHDTGFVAFAGSVYRSYDAGTTWQQTNFVFDSTDFDNQIDFIEAVSTDKVFVGC